MARLYFLRHQAAGILHDSPFTSPPSQADIDALLKRCEEQHGTHHPKTGVHYWAKVVEIDTDKAPSDPARLRTFDGAGPQQSAEAVDKLAAGHCPIREGEIVPAPRGEASALAVDKIGVSGTGHVKNP